MIKLFKKRDADLDKYIDDLLDDLDYYRAELAKAKFNFDQYKKQQIKLNRSKSESDTEKIIERLLDVKESLEMAQDVKGNTREDFMSMKKGIKKIVKQTDQALVTLGVEIIDPKNEPFDPEYHEALKRSRVTTLPDETVMNVYSKGYMWHDRVLRPARVAVSTGGVRRKKTNVSWEGSRRRRR